MSYYLIVCREDANTPWSPQFGDKDRSVANEEAADMRRPWGVTSWGRGNVKVVRIASARRSDCDAAVRKLNESHLAAESTCSLTEEQAREADRAAQAKPTDNQP